MWCVLDNRNCMCHVCAKWSSDSNFNKRLLTKYYFQVELSQDLTDYYRRIRLKEFFLDLPPTEPEPFRKKSTWVPPKNRIAAMETYVQAVSTQVNYSPNLSRRTHDNLPREERQALNSLWQRTDIIIKPAD